MNYFKDSSDQVYAYPSDGGQDDYIEKGLISISEAETKAISNPPPTHDELVDQANTKKTCYWMRLTPLQQTGVQS
ncbi:hypothetical protein PHA77_10595 [Edwardsiella tarda]|uniref:hypothetical protein n=1 Tax=Edwardsiella tarda TaxID=636 RepID=UPI002443CAB0|nr:hypothetical protein [Edwardsiella tarda]WGE30793.1 hypothetical protein PHA77_10595 [Edwardsiella tarda]